MNVNEILALFPDKILEDLALETGLNKYSKKLQAEIVFKLLIYCILSHKDNSLRTMESVYETMSFNLLQSDTEKKKIRYSSISERLSRMNYIYFEKLFYKCVEIYGKVLGEEKASLTRFDSTIVAVSGQLLKVGYQLKGSSHYLKQLKFTIGLSDIPTSADIYLEHQYVCENIALRESILTHRPSKSNPIRVFDRGLSSQRSFEEFTLKQIPFITRLNTSRKTVDVTINTIIDPIKTDTLEIYSDNWVYLFSEGKKGNMPVRCIKAIIINTRQPIWFVSNIPEFSTVEVTTIYKRRWDIETFFKFLKQELNLSHLINRSENGIKLMLFATLIASILLIVYKKTNGLTGYKIMRLRFVQDLEKWLMMDIVFMLGGDMDKAKKLFFNSS